MPKGTLDMHTYRNTCTNELRELEYTGRKPQIYAKLEMMMMKSQEA